MEFKFGWISRVIESCKSDFHFACVDVLITLFASKYDNSEMVSRLKILRDKQWIVINGLML